jgi:hypothetical protein
MIEPLSDKRYYDPFRYAYSSRKAKQGHVWLDSGVPMCPTEEQWQAFNEDAKKKIFELRGEYFERLKTGEEPNEPEHDLTEDKYLCEASPAIGFEYVTVKIQPSNDETDDCSSMLLFDFIDMDPSEGDFKAFTDKWGLLEKSVQLEPLNWQKKEFLVMGTNSDDSLSDRFPFAMSLKRLRELHRDLRFCCVLWRLLDSDNLERLSEIFTWHSGNETQSASVLCRYVDSEEKIKYELGKGRKAKRVLMDGIEKDFAEGKIRKYDVEWKDTWDETRISTQYDYLYQFLEPGNVKEAAWLVLSKFINRYIPRLTEPRVILKKNITGLFPAIRPVSLLGALWLQFYLIACGERVLKRCELCGEWDYPDKLSGNHYHRSCYTTMKTRQYRADNKNQGKKIRQRAAKGK